MGFVAEGIKTLQVKKSVTKADFLVRENLTQLPDKKHFIFKKFEPPKVSTCGGSYQKTWV